MLKESTLLLFFLTIIIGISFIFGITVPCDQTYLAENGKLCYPCGAGYYKVSDCVINGEQARCRPCGNGKYQPYCDNSIKCELCVSCLDPRQVKIKNCTAISNTECQCKAGFYWKSYTWMHEESHCIEHSKCNAGEGLVETGTPFEDTKCEPCRESVSYSDNSSFDSCTTCTVCSTTVVYKCTAIQDTVCSDQVPQRPTQTKNSSKRLGEGAIAGIVCFVIFIGAVFVVVYSIYRYRRNNTLNSDVESHKVAISNTNDADGENDISKAQSDEIAIETETTPEDTKSANKSYHSDESEEGSVKSYTDSQQRQEHVFENDAFDSKSCTESKTQKESENNAIECEQEAKSYPLPQTTIVNDNDPNNHFGVNGLQTDSTESSDENLKEEDAKGQKQFPGKPKQSEYELKNTDSSQSCNKHDLPTDPVKNNDTPLKGKITSGNEKIKDDQLRFNNGKDTDVSKDVAAVSPRDSLHCGGSNREGVAEESMICAVSKQNNILNSDIEPHKVALSNTNADGENGISKAQSEDVIVITTEIPENIQSANKSSHFDESEEGSVKSYTYSQQSQEHVLKSDAFDSLSCTELKTQKESEYNFIEDEQEAKCYPSPLTILVNGNDPNTHLGVSGIQTDSTESSDENLKEEDANEQIQFLGKTSLCNNNDLPTDLVTNIDTSLEGKTTSANEKIKDDQLRIINCEDTDVSLDAAAVSPRDSLHCGGPNREDVTEESMTEETGSGIQSQTGGNSKGNRAEKTVRSNDCISKEIVWYEIKTFLSLNLKSSEFHSFIMELVAKTNGGLLRTIDVVINHAKEENKAFKDTIYSVMNKWRQATPEATVRCVYDALKECSLNLKCEELEETLEQKGLLERINSSFQYMTGHNEETGQKHYLPPDECSAQSRREINHEIDELKE